MKSLNKIVIALIKNLNKLKKISIIQIIKFFKKSKNKNKKIDLIFFKLEKILNNIIYGIKLKIIKELYIKYIINIIIKYILLNTDFKKLII